MSFLNKSGLERLWAHIVARLGEKVDKVEGKVLSTNDYTTDEKTKLAGIEDGATNTDYAASNEYYTATFDGVGTLYSNISCNLYSVTINNGKIPPDLTGVEPIGISLIVAFEESSEASSSNYVALRINNSNYYLMGGRNPTSGGGSLLKPTNQLFLNNPRRIEFSLKSSYDASSIWRGLWIIPDSGVGLVKSNGDTMTGNLTIETSLYPSLYLQPTYNNTTNRTVFEGSYYGCSSFAAWEDSTGNNRRMLEVRTKANESSIDNAVVLRTCENGTWNTYRLFHSGTSTPISINQGGTGATTAPDALTNLGAVKKTGDTMTGSLTIENSISSSLKLDDTSSNSRGDIFAYNNKLALDSKDLNVGDSRRLVISNATAEASKDRALLYTDVNSDGSGSSYRIFHAGMETPIPIANGGTEATSASGALIKLGAVAKAGDTMGGTLIANATSVATLGTAQVRNIWAGTADISEVESSLNEGDIYLQYEEG